MKVKSQNKTRRLIVGILLFLILSITAIMLLLFRDVVQSELNGNAKQSSYDLAAQLQAIINLDFQNAQNNVLNLAESVTTLARQDDNIIEYLHNLMRTHTFENLYYVNMAGLGVSVNNEARNFANSIHFYNPTKDQVTISKPYFSENNSVLVDIAAPLFQNNMFNGIIVAEYSFTTMENQIKNALKQDGYILISDGGGSPVFVTSENYVTLPMLHNNQLHDGVTLEEVSTNIQNRLEGSFSFNYESKTWFSIYKPLDVFNWYVVLMLDEAEITHTSTLVVNLISVISFLVFIVLMVLLWYTLHSKVTAIETIEKIAYYDELTGLPNITKFKMHVIESLKKYPNEQFAMIKNDIVNFKAINEMYGFEMGNKVLEAFAATAELATEKTFMLARVDADKFIFFSGGGFLENLDSMTPFYEEYFKKAVPSLGNHHLEFNYGRYIIKPGETDVNDIINKTTIAHSLAKKNRVQSNGSSIWDYNDSYTKEILLQTLITNKMKKALSDNEFVLYLQTKVNLKHEKVVGAEALVRWIEGDGTMVYPGMFIPLFEKNGFVEHLDMYILKKVCETIQNWLHNDYECVPISVNFSRLHLKNSEFVNTVINIVDSYEVPHNLIEVELTESTVIDNEAVLETLLNDFYSAGFLVSIDDFGAGYSSLGLLKNFKLHTIKLDRSFFVDDTSERAELVVEGIIKLAHTLDIKVVAEGIEEQRQIDFLKKVKCETVQGYYFDKPMPSDNFTSKHIRKN